MTIARNLDGYDKHFKNSPLFDGLTEEQFLFLSDFLRINEYSKDSIVFRENETNHSVFFILKGSVKIYRELSDGSILDIAVFREGDFFGEMAFLDMKPRSATAMVMEDSTLAELSTDAMKKLEEGFKEVALQIKMNMIKVVNERFRDTTDRHSYQIIWGKILKGALSRTYDELVEANKELVASNLLLNGIIDASLDPVMVFDENGGFEVFNPASCRITGYSLQDLASGGIEVLFEKQDVELIKKTLYEGTELRNIETFIKTKNGGRVAVEYSLSIIPSVKEGPKRGVCIARDLTQKKIQEQQILRNEKLSVLGRLASEVVHEIKNPLSVILLAADEAEAGLQTGEKFLKFLSVIRTQVERIQKMVSSIMAFARESEFRFRPVELREVVEAALEFSRPRIKIASANISVDVPERGMVILADRNQIIQVLVNLIVNATDALMEVGRHDIEIRAGEKPETGELFVSISDNGPGIDEEMRKRLFEPFVTTKAQGKGTGLGLSICQSIMQKHHGRIEVESVPGEGATFTVFFPSLKKP